ncbi:hypothetical protein G5C51_24610 [Streptomyces sp. A7024]|uniref:DUF4232 domain-containing protein n=1 Tax=Streptomyces coryli TaxID=1128680 RepID=A0A6G4U705_9ACTN|nr:hypothetical protein [Streptomyces coryli]NGN67077.1 hypothetical protein [Streptomyces coryli]
MRPRCAIAVSAAAAAALSSAPAPAAAMAAETAAAPRCGTSPGRDFPVKARLTGMDTRFAAGDPARAGVLHLRNATDSPCLAVHPVAVLTDRSGRLTPSDIRLRFYDGGRWRAIPFRKTERAENVGVFDAAGPGLRIAAGETLDVPVRLGFAGDTPAGEVKASVTTVARRGSDGDWVGQSREVELTVRKPGQASGPGARGKEERAERGAASATPGSGGGSTPGHDTEEAPGGGISRTPSELADSGWGDMLRPAGTVGAFLLGGGALVVGSRRLRRR